MSAQTAAFRCIDEPLRPGHACGVHRDMSGKRAEATQQSTLPNWLCHQSRANMRQPTVPLGLSGRGTRRVYRATRGQFSSACSDMPYPTRASAWISMVFSATANLQSDRMRGSLQVKHPRSHKLQSSTQRPTPSEQLQDLCPFFPSKALLKPVRPSWRRV